MLTSSPQIQHFNALASRWWDPSGPFSILHHLNPLRLEVIKKNLCDHLGQDFNSPTPFQGTRLLDIGCGGGLLTEPLCRLGADVTGLDVCEQAIQTAKDHALQQDLPLTYRNLSIEDFQEAPFDALIAMEVVEHVQDPFHFLQECDRLLKPGGMLILSTLNRTFFSYVFGILAAEYLLRWVPVGTHSWEHFLTPQELTWFLKKLSFSSPLFQGLSFSLRKKWHLSSDISMNYFAAAVKAP